MTVCQNPGCRKKIADGDRTITVTLAVDWGDDDARDEWEGGRAFCSFGCLAAYAATNAKRHDHRTVAA